MATGQTRSVRIITKKTAIPGRIPSGTTGNEQNLIQQGELAQNTADRKLYSFDGTDVYEIGSNSFLSLTGGTINGNVNVLQNFSATTFISGSTPLNIIIENIASANSGGTSGSLWSSSTGTNSIIANNGTSNLINGNNSFTSGSYNFINSNYSIIAGGRGNTIYSNSNGSFIGGGYSNVTSGECATIAGGFKNKAYGFRSNIAGGGQNYTLGHYSSIGGGASNYTSGAFSFIGGGAYNIASGINSAIIGGTRNSVLGQYSIILGGNNISGASDNTVYIPNARLAETTGSRIYSAGTPLENIFSPAGLSFGLSQVLSTNDNTGGNSIIISPGDSITTPTTLSTFNLLDGNNIWSDTSINPSISISSGPSTKIALSLSGTTVFGNLEIYGNIDVAGTASTFNTRTVQTSDNNITMNLSGSHVSALYGGITVLSGTPNGNSSTWTIDSNGAWSANTQIFTSAITVNGGAMISGSTNLYDLFDPIGSLGDVTRVQPGSNITTGGTGNFPIISIVDSPIFNGFTSSGLSQLNTTTSVSLNTNTLSANTIYSAGTPLQQVFAFPGLVVNNVNAGSNITTGGTPTSPIISVASSPSFNNLTTSGNTSLQALTSTTFTNGSLVFPISATSNNILFATATNTIDSSSNFQFQTFDSINGGRGLYINNTSSGNFVLANYTGGGGVTVLNSPTLLGAIVMRFQNGGNVFDITSDNSGVSGFFNGRTFYMGSSTAATAKLQIGGVLSIAPWSTVGVRLALDSTIFTDTGVSGTRAAGVADAFNIPTFAATNTAVTITNAATVYIAGAPITGTNMSITNPMSLWVAGGLAKFDGDVKSQTLSATTLSANTIYSANTNLSSIFAFPGLVVNNINAGSNIVTGGTSTSPIISAVPSPSFNNLTTSGITTLTSVSANTISATTLSANTIYSANTNLSSIFQPINGNTVTLNGLNTYTGGTFLNQTINVSALTINTLTASGNTSLQALTSTTFTNGSTTYPTTVASGNILFASAANVVGSSSNFIWNNGTQVQTITGSFIANNLVANAGPTILGSTNNATNVYGDSTNSNGNMMYNYGVGYTGSTFYAFHARNTPSGTLAVGQGAGILFGIGNAAYFVNNKFNCYLTQAPNQGDKGMTNSAFGFSTALSGTVAERITFAVDKIGVNTTTPTAYLDLPGSFAQVSATVNASLRIRSGITPTTINNGDFWNDGTFLNIGGIGINVTGSSTFASVTASTFSATSITGTTFKTSIANTDIVYSNNGVLTGDASLTWNTSTSTLQLGTSNVVTFRTSGGGAFLATSSASGLQLYPPTQNTITMFDQTNGNPGAFQWFCNTASGVTMSIGLTPGFGTQGASRLDIQSSTTTLSSIRIRSGSTPTNSNNGDLWNDGTNLVISKIGISSKGYTVQQINVGNANSAQTVDVSSSDQFTYTLTGNSTFTFQTMANGKSWLVGLTQNATTSGFTATFTAGTTTIKYPFAIIPVMTTTTGSTDIYSFTQLNNIIYCDYSQSYS